MASGSNDVEMPLAKTPTEKGARLAAEADHLILTVLHPTHSRRQSRVLLEASQAIVLYHYGYHRSKVVTVCSSDHRARVLLRSEVSPHTILTAIETLIVSNCAVDLLETLNALFSAHQAASAFFCRQRIIVFSGLLGDAFCDTTALRHVTRQLRSAHADITFVQIGTAGPVIQQVVHLINGKRGKMCFLVELNPIEDIVGKTTIIQVFRKAVKPKKTPVEAAPDANEDDDDGNADERRHDQKFDWDSLLMFVETTDDEPSTSGGYRSHLRMQMQHLNNYNNYPEHIREQYDRLLGRVIQLSLMKSNSK